MADKFDPYREALVMEIQTEWPAEYAELAPERRMELEQLLHAAPEQASQLHYVRTHTGFCRRIVVTPDDYGRVAS